MIYSVMHFYYYIFSYMTAPSCCNNFQIIFAYPLYLIDCFELVSKKSTSCRKSISRTINLSTSCIIPNGQYDPLLALKHPCVIIKVNVIHKLPLHLIYSVFFINNMIMYSSIELWFMVSTIIGLQWQILRIQTMIGLSKRHNPNIAHVKNILF